MAFSSHCSSSSSTSTSFAPIPPSSTADWSPSSSRPSESIWGCAGITLIACAIYVVTWQIVYFNFIPDFGDLYAQHVIEKMRVQGATAAAIEATATEAA